MKKEIIFITIVIFVLSGGYFYWYQLRPSKIRIECKKYVSNTGFNITSESERASLNWDMNKINAAEREKSDWWYKDCLNENGLKE